MDDQSLATQSSLTAQASAADTFRQKIIDALNNLVVLHVTTAIGHVGTVTVSEAGAVATVGLDDPAPKVANSVINTVTGDSTETFTPDFVGNPDLMTLHANAVQTARDVRKETIALLKTVLQDFESLLTRKPAG